MGGQACVLYGAAEFSRDLDLSLLLTPENLALFRSVLNELGAVPIAVPPFEESYLKRGHAVHFRCSAEGVSGLRIDVMSTMRGVDDFEHLWKRRTTIELAPEFSVELLSLQDLVQAKKTQRDKDWPMIRRLLEVDYITRRDAATEPEILFWFRELRTPEFILELRDRYPAITAVATASRPLLTGSLDTVREALLKEELEEREIDRKYWSPLKKELEALRRKG